MRWCVEFVRKEGTMNANQALRTRRVEVTARDENEAILNGVAEAAREGFIKFFRIRNVRKI